MKSCLFFTILILTCYCSSDVIIDEVLTINNQEMFENITPTEKIVTIKSLIVQNIKFTPTNFVKYIIFLESLKNLNKISYSNINLNEIPQNLILSIFPKLALIEIHFRNIKLNSRFFSELLIFFDSYNDLQLLDLSDNKFSDYDANIIKKDHILTNLKSLLMKNISIKENDFSDIIKKIKNLEYIDLSQNNLNGIDFETFFNLNANLKSINLSFARMDNEKILILSRSITILKELREINLSSQEISRANQRSLFKSIKNLKNLEKLVLNAVDLKDGLKYLLKSFENLTSIKYLDLSDCNIDTEYVSLFTNFKFLKNLTHLDLSTNSIGETMELILKENLANLNYLDISGNKLGERGIIFISNYLGQMVKLEHLDLSWNLIGENGAEILYSVLKNLVNLKFISLKGNNIKVVQEKDLQFMMNNDSNRITEEKEEI